MPQIIAGIDGDNQIRIEVNILGLYKTIRFGAIVDTGYSGGLTIPLLTAVDIGLEKVGGGNITLADGSVITVPIFLCKVEIGNTTSDVSSLVMGNDVLIGMELLTKFKLCVDAGTRQVSIEEQKSTAQLISLVSALNTLRG